MTTNGCGISSPPLRAFKNFQAIIKIRADAVCCIPISTVLSNQSLNQYHLQSPDVRFSAKMHQILYPPKNPEGRVYIGRGGRPPPRCPLAPVRHIVKEKKERECTRDRKTV